MAGAVGARSGSVISIGTAAPRLLDGRPIRVGHRYRPGAQRVVTATTEEIRTMEIVRNDDGTLLVPVAPSRHHDDDVEAGADEVATTDDAPATRLLHPGEGGYDEALAEWDREQNPDREPVVSTATGRQEAMALVHAVATSPDHAVEPAVDALDDPAASGEALRHVLVGGVPSVEGFAAEVAAAEGGEPLPAHQATKIIGEVLAELDG
jgi:hypothetical protein